jgi:hypothetical protein
MIRCLLFGHKPHPLLEYARVNRVHRLTPCERCGQAFTHVVAEEDWPLPANSMSDEERYKTIAGEAGRVISDRVLDDIDYVLKSYAKDHPKSAKCGRNARGYDARGQRIRVAHLLPKVAA